MVRYWQLKVFQATKVMDVESPYHRKMIMCSTLLSQPEQDDFFLALVSDFKAVTFCLVVHEVNGGNMLADFLAHVGNLLVFGVNGVRF